MIISTVFSVSTALTLIKLTQMVEFLLLLNVVYPSNLSSFLSLVSSNIFDELPNLVEFLTDRSCEISLDKFVEEDISCQIFGNLGSYLILLLALVLAKIIFSGLAYFLKQGKLGSIFSGWANKLDARFWMEVFEGIQLDIFMSLFLGIVGSKSGSTISGLNFLVAGGLTLAWTLFNGFLIFSIQNLYHLRLNSIYTSESFRSRKDELFYTKVALFVEDYNTDTFFQRNYRPINNFKDIIVSFCLIFSYTNPFFQMGTIICLMALTTALSIAYKPLKETKSHIVSTIKASVYCLCCVMMFLIRILENKISKKSMYKWMGYPTIGVICLLFAFNLGMAAYNSIQNCRFLIKERFCNKKENDEGKEGAKNKSKSSNKSEVKNHGNRRSKRTRKTINHHEDSSLSIFVKNQQKEYRLHNRRKSKQKSTSIEPNHSENKLQKDNQKHKKVKSQKNSQVLKNIIRPKNLRKKANSRSRNNRPRHPKSSEQDRKVGMIPMKKPRNQKKESKKQSRNRRSEFRN